MLLARCAFGPTTVDGYPRGNSNVSCYQRRLRPRRGCRLPLQQDLGDARVPVVGSEMECGHAVLQSPRYDSNQAEQQFDDANAAVK